VINISGNNDTNHLLTALHSVTLQAKFQTMTSKANSEPGIPKETPPIQPQPEVKPPVEPVTQPGPVEDPHVQPEERPEEISPYDFPPPGEGFFPEIFE
jgi:hypothetical protein